MKLLIMQFSPTSRHFICFRPKNSPQQDVKRISRVKKALAGCQQLFVRCQYQQGEKEIINTGRVSRFIGWVLRNIGPVLKTIGRLTRLLAGYRMSRNNGRVLRNNIRMTRNIENVKEDWQ
jgi:hypothetical protein